MPSLRARRFSHYDIAQPPTTSQLSPSPLRRVRPGAADATGTRLALADDLRREIGRGPPVGRLPTAWRRRWFAGSRSAALNARFSMDTVVRTDYATEQALVAQTLLNGLRGMRTAVTNGGTSLVQRPAAPRPRPQMIIAPYI